MSKLASATGSVIWSGSYTCPQLILTDLSSRMAEHPQLKTTVLVLSLQLQSPLLYEVSTPVPCSTTNPLNTSTRANKISKFCCTKAQPLENRRSASVSSNTHLPSLYLLCHVEGNIRLETLNPMFLSLFIPLECFGSVQYFGTWE